MLHFPSIYLPSFNCSALNCPRPFWQIPMVLLWSFELHTSLYKAGNDYFNATAPVYVNKRFVIITSSLDTHTLNEKTKVYTSTKCNKHKSLRMQVFMYETYLVFTYSSRVIIWLNLAKKDVSEIIFNIKIFM